MAFHCLFMGQVINEIWTRNTNAMNNVIGKKNKGYAIYITFSKQILDDKLLQVVISKKKKKTNFSGRFKLKPITSYTYNLL